MQLKAQKKRADIPHKMRLPRLVRPASVRQSFQELLQAGQSIPDTYTFSFPVRYLRQIHAISSVGYPAWKKEDFLAKSDQYNRKMKRYSVLASDPSLTGSHRRIFPQKARQSVPLLSLS